MPAQSNPAQPIIPSLILLAILVVITLAAGLAAVGAAPIKTTAVMMALVVYPGPYLLYGLFGFVLSYVLPSPVLRTIFSAGATILFLAWFTVNAAAINSNAWAASFHQSLFTNAMVATVIAAGFASALALGARLSTQRRQRDGWKVGLGGDDNRTLNPR